MHISAVAIIILFRRFAARFLGFNGFSAFGTGACQIINAYDKKIIILAVVMPHAKGKEQNNLIETAFKRKTMLVTIKHEIYVLQ